MYKFARSGNRAPQVVDLCKLLANDSRRRILMIVGDGPADVSTIAKRARLDIAEASRVLGLFYHHDLVEIVVDGKRRIYELTDLVRLRRSRGLEELTVWAADGGSLTMRTATRSKTGRRRKASSARP